MKKDIAIVGMGLISPLGSELASEFEALCSGACGIRMLDRFDMDSYECKRGGQLPEALENELREKYPDEDLAFAMLAEAGKKALGTPSHTESVGLVVGTNFGLLEIRQWAWQERLDTGVLDEETYAPCDRLLEHLAETLKIQGPKALVSMSCASGNSALRSALDMLEQGRARKVLVLAYDELTENSWCGLSNLRTISTDAVRPFDIRRSGTIFGEAAAALLLDGAESAEDIANPLAWIWGCATNNNAFHLTAPCKEAEGSRRVMASALKEAGIAPSEIQHICAHATGTHGNDSTEAACFHNLFGDGLKNMSVAAHKSQLGHLLGAASLAELIVTVMAMREGRIPPTLNHSEPDPQCGSLNCLAGNKAVARSFDVAITNSAGLGGNNAAVVLGRHRKKGSALSLENRENARFYVENMAWILPQNQGQGGELLAHPSWFQQGGWEELASLNPKQFIRTVKGYLDPTALFQLAAFSLLLKERSLEHPESIGISTATRYGAEQSAFTFYKQMRENGPRRASPMIFPHGYPSTAGNLSAIEFGVSGPHQVFYGHQDCRENLFFALERLWDGSAEKMLCGVNEGAPQVALPDGRSMVPGALALELTRRESSTALFSFTWKELVSLGEILPECGMVSAWGNLFCKLLNIK